MAKKQTRKVSRPAVVEAPVTGDNLPKLQGNGNGTRYPVRSSAPASSTEFNPDYSYVVKDLKRIGILAGSFITVLVVLSFFLR